MNNEAIKLQVQKKIKEILLQGGLCVANIEVIFKPKKEQHKKRISNERKKSEHRNTKIS